MLLALAIFLGLGVAKVGLDRLVAGVVLEDLNLRDLGTKDILALESKAASLARDFKGLIGSWGDLWLGRRASFLEGCRRTWGQQAPSLWLLPFALDTSWSNIT